MAHVKTITWPVLGTAAIAVLQDVALNASFVLNGPIVSNGSVSFGTYARTISFTSTNNLSAAIFTITGYVNGVLTTSNVTGPNNSTTYSAVFFTSVTGITSNAAVLQVSVGTGQTGYTNWFLSDSLSSVANLTVAVTATANINYSFQVTLDDITSVTTPKVFTPIAALTAATTTQIGNYAAPSFYSNIIINSSNATGTLVAQFLQQGVR